MKKILFTVIYLFCVLVNMAQTELCSFDNYKRINSISVQQSEQTISSYLQQSILRTHLVHGGIFKIPVVVHVIHDGGVENISDAQIQSQIDVLNEDYRKIFGSNGFGNGVDTEIEFCLAKRNPDGDCTNGIVRIKSPLAYHDSYERPMLSALSSWDPTRYLNIYVVKTMAGGVLGYASFPGGPPNQDGVVMVHNAFGTMGTVTPPYNQGRTCSHESGHWFGLYHTFNGGCGVDTCADGDLVCDTPPVVNPNFNCPVINSCNNDMPDVNDQVENYMDYTNDACKSMFTAGQRDRMQATLNTLRMGIWQPSNITATGCDSGFVSPPCNVVADFIANGTQICINNTVLFTNKTLNNATSFQWSFPGGTPATDTLLNPSVTYNTLGTFDVTLIATGALGTDTLTLPNYITVTPPQAGQAIPYDETFEQFAFPPNGIVIDNPDNGITWERDTIAIMFNGFASAKINNLINTNYGQSDALILPDYDFTSFTGTPYITFRWAYAKSDVNYSDEMLVLLSTNCGLTYTQIFYRTGASLATGATQTTPYIPDSTTVWKKAKVNLNAYASFINVKIKIVNVTDGGNNLYVDSLHIGSILSSGIEEESKDEFHIFPNPASDIITIQSNFDLKNAEIKIINVLGEVVFSQNINKTKTATLNVEELKSGIYFIQLKSENIFYTQKIIKQ